MMKRAAGTLGAVVLAAAAFSAPAAAENREFSWSMTVGGTSDYVFRGISFNNEDPAAQGSIDMTYGIFYAGAWASNIADSFGPYELDLYAGITPSLGQINFDFGILGYLYPAADDDFDYIELKAGASTDIVKDLNAGVTFFYTPDSDNYAETWTVEGSLSYALPKVGIFSPSISGLVGYSENLSFPSADAFGFGVPDYVYWNAGLEVAVENFTMDFRYWDTDIEDGLADERFVFSAKVTVP